MWRATVPMPRLGDTSITFTQRPWGMGLPVGSLRKLVDVGRGGGVLYKGREENEDLMNSKDDRA